MKKKILSGLIVLFLFGLTACTEKENDKEDKKSEFATTQEDEKESISNENDTNETTGSGSDTIRNLKIKIYYPSNETEEMVAKEVEVEQIDAQIIWKELQKTGIVDSTTFVLGIETNLDEGIVILDLNEAFGKQLRSMGTTGEKELLNSIVYTYLDAFQCNKIKLTEKGGLLVSGHKEYEGYLEKTEGE